MLLHNLAIEEQRVRQRGDIPILVPQRFAEAQAYQRELVRQMREQERIAADPNYIAEQDKALRDTKPAILTTKNADGRSVMVVGGRKMFREDMKELGQRILEKPDPKTDPKWQRSHDVLNDLDMRDELVKRFRRRQGGTYHIKNNPISRKDA